MERLQGGILCGLSLYAIGALLFVPAAGVASFTFFLFALFVIALGLGCLETAANSYSSALGSTETAETRLNLSQSFNGAWAIHRGRCSGDCCSSAATRPAAEAGLMPSG